MPITQNTWTFFAIIQNYSIYNKNVSIMIFNKKKSHLRTFSKELILASGYWWVFFAEFLDCYVLTLRIGTIKRRQISRTFHRIFFFFSISVDYLFSVFFSISRKFMVMKINFHVAFLNFLLKEFLFIFTIDSIMQLDHHKSFTVIKSFLVALLHIAMNCIKKNYIRPPEVSHIL